MQLLTSRARAYVYAGMWVADCPAGCKNVETLFYGDAFYSGPRSGELLHQIGERRGVFHCSNCQHMAEIEWSPDEAEIMAVLSRRPNKNNRHWYPAGHEFAIRAGLPHGQTVQDLIDENREHGVN